MARTTQHQFRKSISTILNLFDTEVKAVGTAQKAMRRQRVRKDFWFFFSHYLPHYGEDKSPEFHREIIEVLEQGNRYTAIAAPRGFSKSTLVSFAYVIWKVLKEEAKFIVLVSATDTLAQDLADFIRVEFQDNPRILEDYGMLLSTLGAEGDFTVGKTRVLARGKKQALRGFRHRQHRPDLIILDDIEKDEEASAPKTVLKTLETLKRGLAPSLNPKTGKLVVVGTLLKSRSVAGTVFLSEEEPYKDWTRKVYKAIERDSMGQETSLWEERFPLENLQEIRGEIGEHAFNAEFQNMPTDSGTALFKPEWLKETEATEDKTASPIALFIDPSPDGIKKNDYKAGIFLCGEKDRFIILEGVFVQGSDKSFFAKLLTAYKKYKDRIVAVAGESNGFQGYFLKDLSAYFEEQGIVLPITSVRATLNKEQRIARLSGYFETGRLLFAPNTKKTDWGKILCEQLEYFPTSGVHDDAPDALEGAVKLLENRLNGGSKITFLPKIKKNFFGRWH